MGQWRRPPQLAVQRLVLTVQVRPAWESPGLPSLRAPLRAWLAQREPARPGLECPGLGYPNQEVEGLPWLCFTTDRRALVAAWEDPVQRYLYSIVSTDGAANAGRNSEVPPALPRYFPGWEMPGSALLPASGWRRGRSRSTIRSPTSQEFRKD